jgi:hypothetical protein
MKLQVLLTTYEIVLRDAPFLQQIKWKSLIVDEVNHSDLHLAFFFDTSIIGTSIEELGEPAL